MEKLRHYSFIAEMDRILLEARERVEEPLSIEGKPLEKLWFIDGSHAISERQGAFVSLFSVASLGVISRKYLEGLPGREHLLTHLIIPKVNGESRAALLMSSLEIMEALRASSMEMDAVIFDGSYLALLLSAYGSSSQLFSETLRSISGENVTLRSIVEDTDAGKIIDETVDTWIERIVKERSMHGFYKSAYSIFTSIYDLAEKLHDKLASNKFIENKLGKRFLIDYTLFFAETTLYLRVLGSFLKHVEENDILPLWVAKESTSRFLSEILDLKSWLSDTVLLDSLWSGKEKVFIILESRENPKALRPVNPPSEPVASRETLSLVYRWNKFDIVYLKVSRHGPVLQASYPHDLASRERVESALAALASLSDPKRGYPRPLSLVHHKTLIPGTLVEALAYKMWQSSQGVLRGLLQPLGRETVL
ncbi:hypothetical protein MA03_08410 [Infirmifilum uzonense]|uniref:NurA domain-containing protein n=1 Tax=Infirmifilum uzonense TaxID=1550241 RepID=A0A0F7CLD9_9CREN|nr:DNA double-strand break repair nuclease NurA [Infirmifilum uzonense]AKG39241.1 hypothetical protein MA03_08410 [Infirmifilum uzonense]